MGTDGKVNNGSRATNRMVAGLSQTAAAAAALLEEGDRAHAGIPTDARNLLLSEIEPDPLQPRRHFTPNELSDLADDITRHGVLQPILVRPPLEGEKKYRLVSGERRWRAAKMAGIPRIPVRVREMSDEEVRAAQLSENILRANLSDIEKGIALRDLYEMRKQSRQKVTWEDIASEVGLGRARINDLFHLASLPTPIAELIETGRLSGSHGIALQRALEALGEAEIVRLGETASRPLGRKVGGYGLSVADLREEIQRLTLGLPEPEKASTSVRPIVQKAIQTLQKIKLSKEEKEYLQQFLAGASSPPEAPPDEGKQEKSSTKSTTLSI
jgi:ParB/RepB/Spo0J family partition protein